MPLIKSKLDHSGKPQCFEKVCVSLAFILKTIVKLNDKNKKEFLGSEQSLTTEQILSDRGRQIYIFRDDLNNCLTGLVKCNKKSLVLNATLHSRHKQATGSSI